MQFGRKYEGRSENIRTFRKSYLKGSASSTIRNWRRFLGDCFILGNNAIPEEMFWAELNSIYPNIQFTLECINKQMHLLDVLVKLYEGKISTDVYFKPIDTHLYLNFKSCHPKACKVNIPFCLGSRVVTIFSGKKKKKKKKTVRSQI